MEKKNTPRTQDTDVSRVPFVVISSGGHSRHLLQCVEHVEGWWLCQDGGGQVEMVVVLVVVVTPVV